MAKSADECAHIALCKTQDLTPMRTPMRVDLWGEPVAGTAWDEATRASQRVAAKPGLELDLPIIL